MGKNPWSNVAYPTAPIGAKKNVCNADVIMIDVDQHANSRYKAEFAGESFDTEHRDSAPSSAATCCHTFKPKSKSS
ncbi:hypothetical protein HMSSN139_37950 [Paenibacillus sp. HMSSN-139]|nr:hypothetical protein HMSSN139_37950 [Paenibacillus sp. HMSSN-139]